MYKLETKEYPKVGEVVALCNVDEPRTVRAIAAVSGAEGWFNVAIDCGAFFDSNNDVIEGTTFVEYQFELDGKTGWRHASLEEFYELVDAVNEQAKDWDELLYIVDCKQMRLYTFSDRKDFNNWIAEPKR